MTPPGTVRIICPAQNVDMTALVGGAAPVITGGYGGITRVARPRRVSATDYAGIDPYTLDVQLLFDGFDEQRSVEPECTTIGNLARNTSSRKGPPAMVLQGAIPQHIASLSWLIDNVQWGDSLWTDGNYRMRQYVTLTFVQVVSIDTVAVSPAKAAKDRKIADAFAEWQASGRGWTYKPPPPMTAFGSLIQKKPATSLKNKDK